MNKKLLIIIVVIIAAVLVGYWWWSSRQSTIEAPLDTSDIEQEMEGLDIGDINTEFKQIDEELDTL